MEEMITSAFEDVLEEMAEGAESDYAERKSFITDDNLAEWAIRKIKAEEAEMNRLVGIADEAIKYYQERKDETKRRFEARIANLTYHLGEYFKGVPHRKLKASEQYALPSGKLSMKYGKTKQKFVDANGNDDKGARLVQWLEDNDYGEYVKVKKEVAWAELKDAVYADGNSWYMLITGEELDGIEAYKTEDEFEVK